MSEMYVFVCALGGFAAYQLSSGKRDWMDLWHDAYFVGFGLLVHFGVTALGIVQ